MAKKKGKAKAKTQSAAEPSALEGRIRDFAAVNLQPESAALPMNDDIEARHAQRTQVDGARRLDAFDAAKKGMAPGAYDAARKLEGLIRIRLEQGDHGRGLPTDPVDDEAPDAVHRRALKRIMASQKIDAVFAKIGDRDAWLLRELLEIRKDHTFVLRDKDGKEAGRLIGWRATVAQITGEANPPAQAAIIRHVCANLAAAFRRAKAA